MSTFISSPDDDDDDIMITLLLLAMCYPPVNSRPPSFRESLTVDEVRRRSGKIRRHALQHPLSSPFWTLFNSKHDDALITLCGFDHASFELLHQLFKPCFYSFTPCRKNTDFIVRNSTTKKGRQRYLCSISCLALGLAWTRTRGSYMILQIIFGLTHGSLSVWLRFSRRMIVKILLTHEDAVVRLPTADEATLFATMINQKYPLIKNCWGAMDGLKLTLQRAGNETQQNNFYNGWTHEHYVTNLFLFSPDGKIRCSYFNAPGVLHDSTMAIWSSIYDQIETVYRDTGKKVVVDSAFASKKSNAMLKSHQNNVDANGNPRQRFGMNRQATSIRQLSEWGMRCLQGSFPRIKDKFRYEEKGERKLILQMIVLLYNFRASKVGQNQIASVYMPYLHRNANRYAM